MLKKHFQAFLLDVLNGNVGQDKCLMVKKKWKKKKVLIGLQFLNDSGWGMQSEEPRLLTK